ncbi:TPA: phage tail protein [Photobacterium damselae]
MNLNELMAVPYVDHGRDLNGLDCWGLVRYVRHHHHHLPLLSSFGAVIPTDKAGMTQCYQSLVSGFKPVPPQNGAIACHFVGETLVHVGVVVDEGGLKVLHTGRKFQRPKLDRIHHFERLALITRYYIEYDYISGLPE